MCMIFMLLVKNPKSIDCTNEVLFLYIINNVLLSENNYGLLIITKMPVLHFYKYVTRICLTSEEFAPSWTSLVMLSV